MKFWTLLLAFGTLLGVFTRPALAFRPETFVSLTVPVYEYGNRELGQDTLTNVDLIYKLSTPSASRITWLIGVESLDSSVSAYFQKLLGSDKYQEIGLRLESNQRLTEEALPGSGRNDFSSLKNRLMIGYSQAERRKLVDRAMEKFFQTFGFYPTTVGAAYLDSYSLDYLATHYSVRAAVNLGDSKIKYTDAYHPGTLTGNQSQPYYPARTNSLVPATSLENKISLPLISWNLPYPGQDQSADLTRLTSVELVTYLSHWSLKSLNEFTHLSLGTDNRISPQTALAFYTDYFQTQMALRERLTLSPQKLSEFGEWFLARYPQTSPAYYFVDPGQKGASYSNAYYRVRLKAEGDKTRVAEVVWTNPGESEPYWYQLLTTDELVLPIYNSSNNEAIDFDLEDSVFEHEYWDLILTDSNGMLRLEPERIISSFPWSFVGEGQVKTKMQRGNYIYSAAVSYQPLTNRLRPLISIILLAVLLFLFYRHGQKK